MSKRSWCAWVTGIFGLTVAATLVSDKRPGQTPAGETPAAAGPVRVVIPNSSTDVNQLLEAYGIVRLPPVKPATDVNEVADSATQPGEPATETTEIATLEVINDLPTEPRYQITRLPPVEQLPSNIIRTGRFEPTPASSPSR